MPDRQPNVIIIVTDDQGYGDMACHGNPHLRTPNLDKLHAESVRLTDYHLDPMCAPSRAALMTGRYSARTGVWSTLTGRYIMRRDETTIAEVFGDSGYRTALFGKWHLGDSYPYRPQDRGFQEVLSFGAGVVGEIPDYWNNDYFTATYQRNGKPERFERYCTDLWFDEAINLAETSGDSPFFCMVTCNAPHGPFNVDEKYSQPYEEMGVPRQRARFYGMIANIDENVGRLRKRLDELGLADDTILLFFGDNGTAEGADVDDEGFLNHGYNAGMRGKKCWAYDGGHRNGCFIHWPAGGIHGGREVSELTAHIDLLPTLIDLCDLERPDGVQFDDIRFDGTSIASLLLGENDEWPERTILVHNQQKDKPKKYKDMAVMAPPWRLTVTEQWGPGETELFDTQQDPGQTQNLLGQHPDVEERLMAQYDGWWDDISEHFGEYSDILIGSDVEPVTKLTCHAWHGERGLYNQTHVREGIVDNGFWAVEIEQAGAYEFVLRRWPEEANTPIRAAIPARTGVPFVDDLPHGVAIPVVEARLSVGEFEASKPVNGEDTSVCFLVKLPAGSTRVQTWFDDANEETRGAYYVYVRRLDPVAHS